MKYGLSESGLQPLVKTRRYTILIQVEGKWDNNPLYSIKDVILLGSQVEKQEQINPNWHYFPEVENTNGLIINCLKPA